MKQIDGQLNIWDWLNIENPNEPLKEPYHFDHKKLDGYKGVSEYIQDHGDLPLYEVWLKKGRTNRKFDICVWLGYFYSRTMGKNYDLNEVESYKPACRDYTSEDFHNINQYSFIPCKYEDECVRNCRYCWCDGKEFQKRWGTNGPMCERSGHTCNREELWRVAEEIGMNCPHECCAKCWFVYCGARCNGAEKKAPS